MKMVAVASDFVQSGSCWHGEGGGSASSVLRGHKWRRSVVVCSSMGAAVWSVMFVLSFDFSFLSWIYGDLNLFSSSFVFRFYLIFVLMEMKGVSSEMMINVDVFVYGFMVGKVVFFSMNGFMW